MRLLIFGAILALYVTVCAQTRGYQWAQYKNPGDGVDKHYILPSPVYKFTLWNLSTAFLDSVRFKLIDAAGDTIGEYTIWSGTSLDFDNQSFRVKEIYIVSPNTPNALDWFGFYSTTGPR